MRFTTAASYPSFSACWATRAWMPELGDAEGGSVLYRVGERVRILLDSDLWGNAGWFSGTVVGIEPYSRHRSFYWVELDATSAVTGTAPQVISVLNPRKIQRLE